MGYQNVVRRIRQGGSAVSRTTMFEIAGEEVECEVSGRYTSGARGVRSLSNGDPGYPDDPPEAEVASITRLDTNEEVTAKLTEAQLEEAVELLYENGPEAVEDAAAEYGDYLYDRYKDEGY